MTKGPGSRWISIQMSPQEQEHLDDIVNAEKAKNPVMTRNRFLRNLIAGLKKPS